MNEHDQDRMKKLLQQALPPVKDDATPMRDLWPEMQQRLDAKPAASHSGFNWAWFDGALAATLLGLTACFPASIPLLLYYL
jgi:hypothetical protein